jgi:hypothetical protein
MEHEIELFWSILYVTDCLPIATNNESKLGSGRPQLHGGSITGAIRCICVISVALAEPPADTK